jgi:hypothetical protein
MGTGSFRVTFAGFEFSVEAVTLIRECKPALAGLFHPQEGILCGINSRAKKCLPPFSIT